MHHKLLLSDDAFTRLEVGIQFGEGKVVIDGRELPASTGVQPYGQLVELATATTLWEEKYTDVFSKPGSKRKTMTMAICIDTVTAIPFKTRAYRTPIKKRILIQEAIDEMLESGVIRPSTSPWASGVTLVPKKDRTTQFCVDYQKLNSLTKKDAHPLPKYTRCFRFYERCYDIL